MRMFTILKVGKLSPGEVKQFALAQVARKCQADPRGCALSHFTTRHPTPTAPQKSRAAFRVKTWPRFPQHLRWAFLASFRFHRRRCSSRAVAQSHVLLVVLQ